MVRGVTQICVHFGEDLQSASAPPRSVQPPAGLWVELDFAWQENACRGVQLRAFCTVDVIKLSETKWVALAERTTTKHSSALRRAESCVPLLTLRHMFCSSSTIFTSIVTQTSSTEEEESLEQTSLLSTLRTHFAQRVS